MRNVHERIRSIRLLSDVVRAWPVRTQRLAMEMMHSYGPPHETTDSMLIWHYNSPWKRTVVYRDEIQHNFPKPHHDALEQTIDYRVPPAKLKLLLAFNGSLLIDRTRGEMSARCASEEMNYLLLNLAHDIVSGKKTVSAARRKCVSTVRMLGLRWPEPYASGFQFTTDSDQFEAEHRTADPDRAVTPLIGRS